jgi:hypothetical protein
MGKTVKTLPNGATILSKHRKRNGEFVYLCFWAGHAQQWVSWLAPPHDETATWAGHYFSDFSKVLEDFEKRCVC